MSGLQVGQVPQPEIAAVGQRVLPQNVSSMLGLDPNEWRLTEDVGASPVLTACLRLAPHHALFATRSFASSRSLHKRLKT